MKQFETTKVTVGEHVFYIRPFAAFTASNISGELIKTIGPALSSIIPALSNKDKVLETDVSSIAGAFSSLSGDHVEAMLKKLLTANKNISVEIEDSVKILDDDLVNELFCGEVQDLFLLAAEVVKVNFAGFFTKLTAQFGNQEKASNLQQILQPMGS